MKTSAALLILCLFHFCFAMVQELDHHAGKDNGSEIHKIEPPCACAVDMTGSQENFCQFAVILGELEAKLRNTEKQLEDLRGEVRASQGNQVAFGASTGISANFGPFNAGFTLAYKNVYISTGMYTPTTGVGLCFLCFLVWQRLAVVLQVAVSWLLLSWDSSKSAQYKDCGLLKTHHQIVVAA